MLLAPRLPCFGPPAGLIQIKPAVGPLFWSCHMALSASQRIPLPSKIHVGQVLGLPSQHCTWPVAHPRRWRFLPTAYGFIPSSLQHDSYSVQPQPRSFWQVLPHPALSVVSKTPPSWEVRMRLVALDLRKSTGPLWASLSLLIHKRGVPASPCESLIPDLNAPPPSINWTRPTCPQASGLRHCFIKQIPLEWSPTITGSDTNLYFSHAAP